MLTMLTACGEAAPVEIEQTPLWAPVAADDAQQALGTRTGVRTTRPTMQLQDLGWSFDDTRRRCPAMIFESPPPDPEPESADEDGDAGWPPSCLSEECSANATGTGSFVVFEATRPFGGDDAPPASDESRTWLKVEATMRDDEAFVTIVQQSGHSSAGWRHVCNAGSCSDIYVFEVEGSLPEPPTVAEVLEVRDSDPCPR
jgi:hypothetical protein